MLDAPKAVFSSGPFVPHGHCYLWKTGLIGLHVTADALIVLAYYSIPIALFYVVRQRRDLPFKWMFLLFAAFIISCGTTHLLDIWTLWYPAYWLSGGVKALTALTSVFAAIEIVPLIPKVLALPSPDDLRQLNAELEASQARVAGILDTASDAVISVDPDQRITLFNRAAEAVFGYTVEEALGQPLQRLMPDPIVDLYHQDRKGTEEKRGSTCRMGDRHEILGRRQDGSEFPAEVFVSNLEVAGEQVCTVFLRDISKRKQAEADFQKQQQFLRQVIDSNPSLIFVKDWDGRFTLANQALANVYSTTIENLIGKTDIDFCRNLTDAEQYAQADRQVMQTLQPLLNLEESFTTPEGTIRYFQSTKQPLVSSDGEVRYVLGVANDITALKDIEAALQQKTEELESFFSSVLDLLCIATVDGQFLRLNPEWNRALGYELSELEGRQFLDFVHPEDRDSTLAAMSQLSEQQPVLRFINRYRHQDDSYRWLEWRSVPKGRYIYAAARDISDRIQAEEELRKTQHWLHQFSQQSPSNIYTLVREANGHLWFEYISSAVEAIHGYTVEQALQDANLVLGTIHPDDLPVYQQAALESMHTLQAFSCQWRIITTGGQVKWLQGNSQPEQRENGAIAWHGVVQDISDRKRAEAVLQLTDFSFESSSMASAWIRADASIMRVNASACRLLGYSRDELVSMHVYDFDPNFPIERWSDHWQALKQHKHLNFVTQHCTKDGRRIPVEVTLNYGVFDGEEYNFASMQDISDRLEAEAILRESEERFRSAFDYSAIGMALVSLDGQWLKVNPALCEIVGYDEEELVALTFQDLTHPDDMEVDLAYIDQVLTGQIRTYQVEKRYVHRQGQIVWGLLTASLVRDGQNQPLYFITQLQDFTERKVSADALQQSESTLRSFFNSGAMMMGIVELYADNVRHLSDNVTAAQFFGSTPDGIQNQLATDLGVRQSHLDLWIGHYRKAVETQTPVRFEYLHGTPTEPIWLAATVCLVDSPSAYPRLSYMLEDITERKQAEEQLRQSEEKLRLALKAAKFGTWEYNFISGKLFQSDVSELYGLEPGQVHQTYEDWKAQVHPEDRDWMQTEFDRAIHEGREFGFEFRIIRPDGTIRWTLSTGAVIHNQCGQPLYAYGIAADISDRKRAEAEQEAQKAFLRQVIDTVPNVIFVKDAEGRFLIVNQAGADVHGATVEAMIGRRETDVNSNFSAAQLQEFLTINRAVMRTRQPHTDLSQVIKAASGEIRWYQTVIKPLINVDGQVTGIVGATTDVTNLKTIEHALQQAKEDAEAANRAKSLFLANMSHELRTPLNVILGFTQVMGRDERLTLDQRENLRSIQRSGDHLLSLINDVLDLSKIEAGHTTVDKRSVDLPELLRSLAQMFRQRAETKGLQLHLELDANVPPYITIDANKLRQILINLLGNAIKFTPQGHVTLYVEARDEERQAAHPFEPPSLPQPIWLHFEVSDTGIGIDAAELGSIFSAFVQTQAGKDSPEGTGLGLTISQRFVQMMGGDITVRSEVGRGSTFAFNLPAQVARSHDVPPAPIARRVIGLAPDQPGYRILVVDDQAENRRLLVTLLNQIGFAVKEAANGQDAVGQWQQWQPHLIYMDVRMPGLTGYEATQQIRASANGQEPIIIALTAQASEGDRALALASGCNDYLSKPFQDEALFNQMAEHLGLTYLYETDRTNASPMDAPQPVILLSPSDLLVMPSAWIRALRQMALLCDDGGVEKLIEQIPPERALLIKGLHQLIQTYSFKQIVALTASGATDGDA